MNDGMPYGRNQGQGQGHSREVDRQSPTGLILVIRFPALENKCLLATDVPGTASSRLATAAIDGFFCRFVARQDSGFWLCQNVGSAR